jgi:hypothetical protein
VSGETARRPAGQGRENWKASGAVETGAAAWPRRIGGGEKSDKAEVAEVESGCRRSCQPAYDAEEGGGGVANATEHRSPNGPQRKAAFFCAHRGSILLHPGADGKRASGPNDCRGRNRNPASNARPAPSLPFAAQASASR